MNKTKDTTPGEVSDISFTYVPRDYITKKKLTLQIAAQHLTRDDEDKTPVQKLIEMQDLKRNCRDMAKYAIENMMIEEACRQEITFVTCTSKGEKQNPVKTVQHLKKAITQNKSLKFFNKLFNVLYGVFDNEINWSKRMEQDFMTKNCFKYSEKSKSKHSQRDKGCFEILINDVKTQIVKEFQRHGKKSSHGFFLTMNVQKQNGKRVQRQKGKFYNDMVKQNKGNTEELEEDDTDNYPSIEEKITVSKF